MRCARGQGPFRWLKVFKLLVVKEFDLEFASKECLTLVITTSLIIGALVGAGVSSALIDNTTTRKLYPMLLWIVFLLTTTAASARLSESELEGRGFEGLILAGVSGAQIYLSKTLVTAALFFFNWLLLIFVLSVVLDQGIALVLGHLVLIGLGASITISALVVLISGIAGTSKLRGVLSPLLTLPLAFPLFLAGVELTTECLVYGAITPGSIWPGVILVSATAFLLVGVNTYRVSVIEG